MKWEAHGDFDAVKQMYVHALVRAEAFIHTCVLFLLEKHGNLCSVNRRPLAQI